MWPEPGGTELERRVVREGVQGFLLHAAGDAGHFLGESVHWKVVAIESRWITRQFQLGVIAADNAVVPDCIHADNSRRTIGNLVVDLLVGLDITRSHSRPRVSDGNSDSGVNFMTLKYSQCFGDAPVKFS